MFQRNYVLDERNGGCVNALRESTDLFNHDKVTVVFVYVKVVAVCMELGLGLFSSAQQSPIPPSCKCSGHRYVIYVPSRITLCTYLPAHVTLPLCLLNQHQSLAWLSVLSPCPSVARFCPQLRCFCFALDPRPTQARDSNDKTHETLPTLIINPGLRLPQIL